MYCKRKVFANFHTKNIFKVPVIFWKWKLCRACACAFADFFYWVHKKIPDRQHSVSFQKSTVVGNDVCRLRTFVGYHVYCLIWFVAYYVCRIMTFVANYDVCSLEGLSQYRLDAVKSIAKIIGNKQIKILFCFISVSLKHLLVMLLSAAIRK